MIAWLRKLFRPKFKTGSGTFTPPAGTWLVRVTIQNATGYGASRPTLTNTLTRSPGETDEAWQARASQVFDIKPKTGVKLKIETE